MSSTAIGEPYQLYLSSTLAQRSQKLEAIYTTCNRDFPGYATVTAQGEGIHIWDLQNLHAVASYSVKNGVKFAIPAFSLFITEDGIRSVISYALVEFAPDIRVKDRGRTVWMIRQKISASTASTSEKTTVAVDVPPVKICGTGHDSMPLLLISKNGSLFLANTQLDVKSQLDWPGEREHLETFVFPRNSCSFIQDDVGPCSSVALTCCHFDMTLHVRLVLLGEEIVPLGTCEIPIPNPANEKVTVTSCLTCSPTGILSFITSRGSWVTHQLVSLNSTLVSTSISENVHLHGFTMVEAKARSRSTKNSLSIISLGTSLVLLVAMVERTKDLALQIWDLSYGVLLAAQSMPVPSAISIPHISLTIADAGQALLTLSPAGSHDESKRSSIHVVPIDPQLKSTIAIALGKTAQTAKWLRPKELKEDDESAKIISQILKHLRKKYAQMAERTFLDWVESHSSREAVLGYEFVKKILNIVLDPDSQTDYPYTPRITRFLLENAVVSTIMLNGRLITMLRQRGDWENVMFALTKVVDISEDELMISAKALIDTQRKNENAMDIDASEGYVPPLWSYLFACVSYPFSAPPMRIAIRKHLLDARDLVLILEILENWMQAGTEYEVEDLFKSLATKAGMSSSKADSPPYPKVITFLHALLDASFVALLQYQPSHALLRRILSHIEPEITFMDRLEPLRGMLEPFSKAQLLKERTGASTESPAEWRKRKKQLHEQASLSVGLYRLEELVI